MIEKTVFVVLVILPAVIIVVLAVQRGLAEAWVYALAAYLLGPLGMLALLVFLWRESDKTCPSCGTACTWNAITCRRCLAPFPLRPATGETPS